VRVRVRVRVHVHVQVMYVSFVGHRRCLKIVATALYDSALRKKTDTHRKSLHLSAKPGRSCLACLVCSTFITIANGTETLLP
jgi:hypothetical protein